MRRSNHLIRPAPSLFVVVAALLLCGCSRFESDWRSPALLKPPASGEPFEGRWKGYWKSVPSGHSGSLRCIATRVDDDTCRVRFKASWALLLRFEYTADMDVEKRDDATYFTGQADLGSLAGGVYHYDGHADGRALYCKYKSGNDHGYFKMTRPK